MTHLHSPSPSPLSTKTRTSLHLSLPLYLPTFACLQTREYLHLRGYLATYLRLARLRHVCTVALSLKCSAIYGQQYITNVLLQARAERRPPPPHDLMCRPSAYVQALCLLTTRAQGRPPSGLLHLKRGRLALTSAALHQGGTYLKTTQQEGDAHAGL